MPGHDNAPSGAQALFLRLAAINKGKWLAST